MYVCYMFIKYQSINKCGSAVRISEAYSKCINTINCTGQSMPNSLLEALDNVDMTQYMCSEDLRPSKSEFIVINLL